jgi:hypothetical protein
MRNLKIYIAASWKHQHAVEMLTDLLRGKGHDVLSFVENNHGEHLKKEGGKPLSFEEWMETEEAEQSFDYDTNGATKSNLVIYIGPSGKDAAAECGMAWAAGISIYGLHAKGEDFGLMRKMIEWHRNYRSLLESVDVYSGAKKVVQVFK